MLKIVAKKIETEDDKALPPDRRGVIVDSNPVSILLDNGTRFGLNITVQERPGTRVVLQDLPN